MLQRTLPAGFIAPCLPTKTTQLPSGSQWLHEIKHDGFRIIAHKSDGRVRLYSRPGNDLTRRFPLVVETLARLRGGPVFVQSRSLSPRRRKHLVVRLLKTKNANVPAVKREEEEEWAFAPQKRI